MTFVLLCFLAVKVLDTNIMYSTCILNKIPKYPETTQHKKPLYLHSMLLNIKKDGHQQIEKKLKIVYHYCEICSSL